MSKNVFYATIVSYGATKMWCEKTGQNTGSVWSPRLLAADTGPDNRKRLSETTDFSSLTGFQPRGGPLFAMQLKTESDASSRISNISANICYEIT